MGLFIWDSEPSKIFVGDTPISRVFLWDAQVRPSKCEYSYDFRNKSATDLSNDWWTVVAWTLETSAYWITSPVGRDVHIWKSGLDLSNANKITIIFTSVWDRDDGTGSYTQFWLMDTNFTFQNDTTLVLSSGYTTSKVNIVVGWTATDGTSIWNIWQSTYASTFEVDLVNKTLTWTVPWLWVSTLSLTDAQVTTIRWLTNIWGYTTQHTFYIQDMSITIE